MELTELRIKINQLNHLKVLLNDLYVQKDELSHKLYTLKVMMEKEVKDVERLEGATLSALLLKFRKDKEAKIEKEKREAYEAELKYNTACNEYRFIESKIEEYTIQINELSLLKEDYYRLLEEKKNTIYDEHLHSLEEQLSLYQSQKKETEEAISVIHRVLADCEDVMSELGTAESWGMFDMVGGNFVTAVAKHSALDNAQRYVEHLQVSLRKLKNELSDIQIYENLNVKVDTFLSIADYLFDGFFVDWMVLDHISSSKREIENIQNQMDHLEYKLNNLLDDICNKQQELQSEIEEYIVDKSI